MSERKTVKAIRNIADNTYGPQPETIYELIDGFMEKLKEVLSDKKITLQEFTMIVLCGIRMSMQFCEILPVNNTRRRVIVMATAGRLFDAYAILVVPPWIKPFWFFISPSLKKALVTATAGAIEFLLPLIRNSYT